MSTRCSLLLVPEAEKGPASLHLLPQTQRHQQGEFELHIRKRRNSNILTSTPAHYFRAGANTQKVDMNTVSVQVEQQKIKSSLPVLSSV